MKRKGLFWQLTEHGDSSKRVRKHRALRLSGPTDKFESEEEEAEWVSKYTTETLKEMKRFLTHFNTYTDPEADRLISWKAPFCVEIGMRQDRADLAAHLERGKNVLSELVRFGEENNQLMRRLHGKQNDSEHNSPNQDVGASIEALVKQLEKIEERIKPAPSLGNAPTTRAVFIEQIWGALKDAGYGLRQGSRIMARGFEICGLESGHESKRENSIYQTIRNLEV